MVIRIWKAPTKRPPDGDPFRSFERAQLELFQSRPGLIGVFFRRTTDAEGTEICASLSLWEKQQTLDALEKSADFARFLADIDASGLLVARPETLVFTAEPGLSIKDTFAEALGS